MKKTYIWTLVFIIIIVGGYLAYQNLIKEERNQVASSLGDESLSSEKDEPSAALEQKDAVPSEEEKEITISQAQLCVDLQGEVYQQEMYRNVKLGIPLSGEKFDYSMLGIEPPQEEKKVMITFSNTACAGCQKFLPLFKEWDKKYADELQIVAVLYGPEELNKMTQEKLEGTSVKTVFKELDFYSQIDPAYKDYETLLINEAGEIMYGLYSIDLPKWEQIDAAIALYVETGILDLENVQVLSQGDQLVLPELTDLKGKKYLPQNFSGKPNVFCLVWPQMRVNTRAYELLTQLAVKYEGQIDFNLILYDDKYRSTPSVKKYYQQYGGDTLPAIQTIEDFSLYVEGQDFENLTVFIDKEWEIFDYTPFDVSPTFILCDENMQIKEIFNLGRCISFSTTAKNITVEEVMLNYFQ